MLGSARYFDKNESILAQREGDERETRAHASREREETSEIGLAIQPSEREKERKRERNGIRSRNNAVSGAAGRGEREINAVNSRPS